MFGMGFLEIVLILIVAVIALGPEKLPSAAVDIAKMFKKLKSSVDDAKSTLDDELNIAGFKNEAEKFKDNMGIDRLSSLSFDSIGDDDFDDKPKKKKKKEKAKIVKVENEETTEDISIKDKEA
jgi:sec-independent protein translocase protein TatB